LTPFFAGIITSSGKTTRVVEKQVVEKRLCEQIIAGKIAITGYKLLSFVQITLRERRYTLSPNNKTSQFV
jgi:hypothetical protein